jgi:TRAP-type C4-dicarboxylate transport system permease small subunit
LKKRVPDFQKAIVFFTILHIYVIFSWWCWWYGGSYGSRPMVDTYGILALPSAITIERITRLKKWTFPIWIAIFGFFICLNIFQIFQYVAKTLHYDSMNQQLYFKQFGKLEKIEGFYDQLSEPNYDQARKGR